MKEALWRSFRIVLYYFTCWPTASTIAPTAKGIVIDGQTAFTGDINVTDKYINNKPKKL